MCAVKLDSECQKNFKIYVLKNEFYRITDWKKYKLVTNENRPSITLGILDEDTYLCIPITKDDDKSGKFSNLSVEKPDFVMPIHINDRYKSYLLIQNMFYIRKEFLGHEYSNSHEFILDDSVKKLIKKKVKKVDALLSRGIVEFVPRETVHQIQVQYLLDKDII